MIPSTPPTRVCYPCAHAMELGQAGRAPNQAMPQHPGIPKDANSLSVLSIVMAEASRTRARR